jgi:hypothetical protein
MRAKVQIVLLGMLLTGIGFAQTSASGAPDVSTIVGRMQAAMAGRNHDRAYSVTREYTLAPEDAAKATKVIAEINSVPPGKKDYTITHGEGQAEKVVRKVLDHEVEPAEKHADAELTAENYAFAYAGTEPIDGHRCYVLQLTPRHDSKDTVNGKVWIDSDSYLVRQVSGTPTKSPSWWIKDLQVTLHYRDMDGLWLQDRTQAVAQVRIVGKHTLTARALDVRTGTELAARSVSQPVRTKRTRRVDPALLGSGVFQHN